MEIIDPGHKYIMKNYDGGDLEVQHITFMKREGKGYPYNVGHHSGTNCQEVLRVLIDRVKYLENQIPATENSGIILSLQTALHLFETRAAKRHKRKFPYPIEGVELLEADLNDGHIR